VHTIDWAGSAVRIIDQTALPSEEIWLDISTVDELVEAIGRLAVRGAPALGVAGAFGVALAARQFGADPAGLSAAVRSLRAARPTAVNLARGVDLAAAALPDPDAVLDAALRLRDAEIVASEAMARLGADLVTQLCGPAPVVLTHCNSGGLATVTGGTALGVVAELHRRGSLSGVIVSETRPLLQGARLTAWELGRLGVDYRVAVDGVGPFLMARGEVQAVLVGADRICANGDVVNKVGTYAHALGAQAAGIPFLVVAPESTVDPDTATGAAVPIEDRDPAEVLGFGPTRIAPLDADATNPAFDVTPHHLVTAVVTDTRVLTSGRTPGRGWASDQA
jgi:S-methyl-5-thioribose-1-phosphate isomerase